MKKIAILGSGAIGCYYGGLLALSGHDVRFLMRSDLETVRSYGLTIHTGGRQLHLANVQAYGRSADIGPCDLVIIALKTTANGALLDMVPPLLGPETALLTLQNGLGNEEFLATNWGAHRVMGGLCFVCVNRTGPGLIEHLDRGSISIGEYAGAPQARTHWIVDALGQAGIDARVVDTLAEERWRKLVWNIPFNGLSICAGGLTVADILASDPLRILARDIMEEVRVAATALGHRIPPEFADYQIERTYPMGPYKTSSLIDWQLGRPVEVESIWGEPCRQGRTAGISMGRVETVYRLLQHLTAASSTNSL